MQLQSPFPEPEKKPQKKIVETEQAKFTRLALAGCKKDDIELLRKSGILGSGKEKNFVRQEFIDVIMRPGGKFTVSGLDAKSEEALVKLLLAMEGRISSLQIKVVRQTKNKLYEYDDLAPPAIYMQRASETAFPSGKLTHSITISGGEKRN